MPEQKEIIEKFHQAFLEFTGGISNMVVDRVMEWSADYWLNVLSTLRTQEREELAEKIKAMKRKVKYEDGTDISKILTEGSESYGYNQALKEVLTLLEKPL